MDWRAHCSDAASTTCGSVVVPYVAGSRVPSRLRLGPLIRRIDLAMMKRVVIVFEKMLLRLSLSWCRRVLDHHSFIAMVVSESESVGKGRMNALPATISFSSRLPMDNRAITYSGRKMIVTSGQSHNQIIHQRGECERSEIVNRQYNS
jgi:hypothetical protein